MREIPEVRNSDVAEQDRVVFVDIGAAEGLQQKWAVHGRRVRPVLFEPNPDEAAKIRDTLRHIPGALVIEQGLSSRSGEHTLTIGSYYGCTSMLVADPDVLRDYKIAPLYVPIGTATVLCERYDDLFRAGTVPAPDAIKLDVEGFESEVLDGFGDLLDGCLGIETEAWFTPVYRGTRLLHEIVEQLRPYGMVLRHIDPIDSFDGDLVVCNAFFTISKWKLLTLDADRRRKFDLVTQVFKLPRY